MGGLYVRSNSLSDGNRPAYVKYRHSRKPTVLFYADDKGGMWKFSNSACSSAGGFARIKDKAVKPWEVSDTWKVYSNGSFEKDAKFKVQLLDPAHLPDVAIEVEETTGSKPTDGAQNSDQPQADELINDSTDIEAHSKVKFDRANGNWHFWFGVGSEKVRFQTTLKACNGDVDMAGRICRHCFTKMANGASKKEAEEYRNELYARLGGKTMKRKKGKEEDGEAKRPKKKLKVEKDADGKKKKEGKEKKREK